METVTTNNMRSRYCKALARLFLRLLKSSYNQFLWSKLVSYTPTPMITEDEYAKTKEDLLHISMSEDMLDNELMRCRESAKKIFGRILTQIIERKFEKGDIEQLEDDEDSDGMVDLFDHSEDSASTKTL